MTSGGGITQEDRQWLRRALTLAEQAARRGEVPVAAVIVRDGECVAARHNETVQQRSSLAHAELLAIADAQRALGEPYLRDLDVYVTLEPCVMCAGALLLSRVRSVTFAAWDPKAGACGSLFGIGSDPRLNHEFLVRGGVEPEPSARLLREFFEGRRRAARS